MSSDLCKEKGWSLLQFECFNVLFLWRCSFFHYLFAQTLIALRDGTFPIDRLFFWNMSPNLKSGIVSHCLIFSILANLQILFATYEITQKYQNDMDALFFCSDLQIRFSYERNDPTEGNWNSACIYQQNWRVVVFAKMTDSIYLNGRLDNWLMELTSPVKICQLGLKSQEKNAGLCQAPRNGTALWGGLA